MGSAERPPKALSERSTEVRMGRVRKEVQRERRDWGISVMSRPVKMSEKSATCSEKKGVSACRSLTEVQGLL